MLAILSPGSGGANCFKVCMVWKRTEEEVSTHSKYQDWVPWRPVPVAAEWTVSGLCCPEAWRWAFSPQAGSPPCLDHSRL